MELLTISENELYLVHILENAKADSGGERDINFLKFLVRTNLLKVNEMVLKRKIFDLSEDYYYGKYSKANLESNRHFLCRAIIEEELRNSGIKTYAGVDVGNMDILHSNSNYDIVTEDFGTLIDIGLTPARNFFRGLTEPRVRAYMLTNYFDDYTDNIIFNVFTKTNEQYFFDAIRDYEEGSKDYFPQSFQSDESRPYYNETGV
jgi:hypothetical protein